MALLLRAVSAVVWPFLSVFTVPVEPSARVRWVTELPSGLVSIRVTEPSLAVVVAMTVPSALISVLVTEPSALVVVLVLLAEEEPPPPVLTE